MRYPMFLLATLVILGVGACDTARKILDEQPAPLKEPELPNCSKVLTCCDNLTQSTLVKDVVTDACNQIRPAADGVIDAYQTMRDETKANQTLSEQDKDAALDELEANYVPIEKGCRCLVDETVGAISLDGFLTPKDCEFDGITTGQLAPGESCTDMKALVTP